MLRRECRGGYQPPAQGNVLYSPKLRANSYRCAAGRPMVAPTNSNVHCISNYSLPVHEKLPAPLRCWQLVFVLGTGIGLLFIRQTGKIIHAGIQCNGKLSALFECEIPFSTLYFGIVTLVNASHHLDFNLCVAFFFTKLFNSAHNAIT